MIGTIRREGLDFIIAINERHVRAILQEWVYFIPGVRHVTAILAGSTQLDFKSFAKFAYPGAMLWSTVFLCLGYYAGDEWRPMLYELCTWLPLVAVFVFAVVVVVIMSRGSDISVQAEDVRRIVSSLQADEPLDI